MELRERIERLICDGVWAKDGHGNSHTRIVGASVVADAILDIPEIKEALASRRFITVDEVRAQMTAPPNA